MRRAHVAPATATPNPNTCSKLGQDAGSSAPGHHHTIETSSLRINMISSCTKKALQHKRRRGRAPKVRRLQQYFQLDNLTANDRQLVPRLLEKAWDSSPGEGFGARGPLEFSNSVSHNRGRYSERFDHELRAKMCEQYQRVHSNAGMRPRSAPGGRGRIARSGGNTVRYPSSRSRLSTLRSLQRPAALRYSDVPFEPTGQSARDERRGERGTRRRAPSPIDGTRSSELRLRARAPPAVVYERERENYDNIAHYAGWLHARRRQRHVDETSVDQPSVADIEARVGKFCRGCSSDGVWYDSLKLVARSPSSPSARDKENDT